VGRLRKQSRSTEQRRFGRKIHDEAISADHAYARAEGLDAFVLNTIELWLAGRESLDAPVNPLGRGHAAPPTKGRARRRGERRRSCRGPAATTARSRRPRRLWRRRGADLDGFLSDTTPRRNLGGERYNALVSDYVAVVNKAEADLADAREASSGSWTTVGALWLHD
jgi:hypothetical protein